MTVQIHVRRSSAQRATEQYVTLDGMRVGFRFRYAAAGERWWMWLLSQNGNVIRGPRKLVPGLDLLAGWKHDHRVPPGALFVHAVDRMPPDADTVDTDARLLYREAIT